MMRQLMMAGAVAMIGVFGCVEKGPAQKAGERADEIIDNVEKGDPPLKQKGPLEKMGDSMDDAIQGKDSRK